jgi:hypothetical protein
MTVWGYFGNFLNQFLQFLGFWNLISFLGLLTVTNDFLYLFYMISVTCVMNCAVFIMLEFFSKNPGLRYFCGSKLCLLFLFLLVWSTGLLCYWLLASRTSTWMLCLILVWCFLDDWQNNKYYTWSLSIFWFWTIYSILHLVLVHVDTTGSGSYLALACHLVLTSFLHFKFISFALPQHKV